MFEKLRAKNKWKRDLLNDLNANPNLSEKDKKIKYKKLVKFVPPWYYNK